MEVQVWSTRGSTGLVEVPVQRRRGHVPTVGSREQQRFSTASDMVTQVVLHRWQNMGRNVEVKPDLARPATQYRGPRIQFQSQYRAPYNRRSAHVFGPLQGGRCQYAANPRRFALAPPTRPDQQSLAAPGSSSGRFLALIALSRRRTSLSRRFIPPAVYKSYLRATSGSWSQHQTAILNIGLAAR